MSSKQTYVLDSNVFIEAARGYYSFDIASGFWEGLVRSARTKDLLSIDRVKQELDRSSKEDKLKQWANRDFRDWFHSTQEKKVTSAYGELMIWSQNQSQYDQGAKADFAKATNADPWIVAFAKSNGYTVVTHELRKRRIKKTIPIPSVCRDFGIRYVSTFDMLRELKIDLKLGK